jgi:hypothetical protein
MTKRVFVWGAAVVALAATAALAQDIEWQHGTLVDGFTIDVPAIVGEAYKPGPNQPRELLMAFLVSAGAPGTLSCQLRREPYTDELPRQTLVAGLKQKQAGAFCRISGANISDWQLGSSDAGTTDGVDSGTCLAAYSDSSQEAQGRVVTMKIVAGRKSIQQLLCISAFDDKDGAVTAYATRWSSVIAHLQESLHLPADEK